jgi:hypothetical protein
MGIIRGACKGTDRLNKKALLSMIGPPRYTRPKNFSPFSGVQYQKKASTAEVLEQFDGNYKAAAASLGISMASLLRRLDADPGTAAQDEPRSVGSTRRYLEGLEVPWRITSFDASKREVCIDIQSGSGTVHLGVVVPSQKI